MQNCSGWFHNNNYANRVPQTQTDSRALSALPSPFARVVAFIGVLIAGAASGAIGFAIVDLQCADECSVGTGIGLFSGAIIGALGMAVVSVLVLRAAGEWRELVDN
jgi:hypothetical protein